MAHLIITTSEGRVFRFLLQKKAIVVGRSPGCDLFLEDLAVSQRHARFALSRDGYTVVDLDSKNGTFVNMGRCGGKVLTDGDQIELGVTRIAFSLARHRSMPDARYGSLHDALVGWSPAETLRCPTFSPGDDTTTRIGRRCTACACANHSWARFCTRCGRVLTEAFPERMTVGRSRPCNCRDRQLLLVDRPHARFCPKCGCSLGDQRPSMA